MSTKVFHRTNCRLCQSTNVELVVKLEPVPLAEKYSVTQEAARSVERFPIDLYMCLDCGHAQQLDVIDSDTLWDDYTYFSGQTKGIIDHFEKVARDLITRYKPPTGSLVIDIGSNDGSLLRPFKAAGYRVLGIDPAKDIAKQATEAGIPTVPQLMSKELSQQIYNEHGPASIVTAFNVFAHTDDLGAMADSAKQMLGPDGIFVFECQYLMDVIDKLLLGTIFHEHMSHHSLKPMSKFLHKHGMELIDVQRVSIQHGSIIGIAQHRSAFRPKATTVSELLELEETRKLDRPEALAAFAHKLNDLKQKISSLVSFSKRTGATIAGYGAARSGPTILAQFGLGEAIECIFDDHPMKTGKFSPGDGIKILPTTELNNFKPDYTFVLAWIHSKRIIENNQRYLREGGKFIICFPDLQVVDSSSALETPCLSAS